MSKVEEDQKKISAQHNTEYMQLKQEKENEVATLKGNTILFKVETTNNYIFVVN